jgi:hypothetical protein
MKFKTGKSNKKVRSKDVNKISSDRPDYKLKETVDQGTDSNSLMTETFQDDHLN